jgi:hypothetical protein
VLIIKLVAECVKSEQHLVKQWEIIVSEQDCETGLGVFRDHERGGFDVDGFEKGMVFGFGVDPVEDFGNLRVVGLVGVDINEVK